MTDRRIPTFWIITGATGLVVAGAIALGRDTRPPPEPAAAATGHVGRPWALAGRHRQTFTGVRAFCGDFNLKAANGLPAKGAGDLPGDEASSLLAANCSYLLIDRFSAGGAVDQCLSVAGDHTGPAAYLVFRRGLVYHSLHRNRHPKGPHGCGALVGYNSGPVLLWECVSTGHVARAALDVTVDRRDVLVEVANCLIHVVPGTVEVSKVGHVWRHKITNAQLPFGDGAGRPSPRKAKVNWVGCLFVLDPGVAWTPRTFTTGGQPYYVSDCWVSYPDGTYKDLRELLSEGDRKALVPHRWPMDFRFAAYDPNGLSPGKGLLESVLPHAGPPEPNALERRAKRQVLERDGRIYDTTEQMMTDLLAGGDGE